MDEPEKDSRKEEEIIEIRKEKLLNFIKKNNFVYYIVLALITLLAVFIRTRNIKGLKDITTGTWTLGPDLDPFLFLRWAEYIVQHGYLMINDTMRYVPLGYDTSGEMKLLSYMIAWFYYLISFFVKDATVTYAAIIFPVVMFALTCIAFFFFVRIIFYDSFENKIYPNLIALISVLFLAVIPSLLPRTIAGIPEKESVGFLFISLSLYFIIKSFKSKDYIKTGIYGVLSGLTTACLALVWGGVIFVFMTIGLSAFFYFMLGQTGKKELLGLIAWIITFIPITMFFSTRYTINSYIISTSTMPAFATLFFIFIQIFIYPKIKGMKFIKVSKEKYKIPDMIIILTISGIILVALSFLILRYNFITEQFNELINSFVRPLATNRFLVTVAENRQPYFTDEWKSSFGPVISGIPIFFWMFFLGSIFLFYNMVNKLEKRDRKILTVGYVLAIFSIIFSKYSPESLLNGASSLSLVVYFGGMFIFICISLYLIINYNKNGKLDLFKLNFEYIILFTLFFISLLAARGGVRFVMVLIPSVSALASYLIVICCKNYIDSKEETKKIIYLFITIILILSAIFCFYAFYQESVNQANVFHPNVYTWQWQRAMSWIRDNTPTNAVFAHWWDYGYWVQSIGKRATVLDGGNAIVYWNHLIGRHVLTTPNDNLALEFLYTHNATHLLIDSTDIGKYTAFSSIGSDENYDRLSYIPTFSLDTKSTKETKNGLVYFYTGGAGIDQDLIWKNNGSEIYLMKENSGIGAIMIEENKDGELQQPQGIFVSNGKQIQIPLKYLYYNNTLHKFDNGLEAGVFLVELIIPVSGNNLQIEPKGTLLYLSNRTVNSLLARKYLFGEEGNFKLVHNEPSFITSELRKQGAQINDFSYYQGQLQGPIKIWEIKYPSNIKINKSYLELDYPNEGLKRV